MPEITCILVSHNKPDYVVEAIDSILSQTFQDWQTILMDSGDLYDRGFFNYIKDSRMEVVKSQETFEIRRTKAPAPWCFNECIRKNMIRGNLVTYLCDDDKWYPNAFETFVCYYHNHTDIDAMYASQDLYTHHSGQWYPSGERRALEMMGRGKKMDCQIDYLQFCHTRKILTRLNGPEYWPENKGTENHADGIFMDKIGDLVPVYNIDIKVSQNRRTPKSTYSPHR